MNKTPSFLSYTSQTLPPAQLWIGNHTTTTHEVEFFLQKMLCKHDACNTCIICMQIRQRQHPTIMWLLPEKNYTIDYLNDLFATLAFQREHGELFFFIIQKAELLTTICANKLLKSIEEPPHGYHFILLAQYVEQILPTIRSRCIEYSFNNKEQSYETHPLYEYFTTKSISPEEFSKIIDKTTINEQESIQLLDTIMQFWITTLNNMHNNDKKPIITSLINTLQKIYLKPPMPGSSTIFWRNLYLQLSQNLNLIFRDI